MAEPEHVEFTHPRLDEETPPFELHQGWEAAQYYLQRNTELLEAWMRFVSSVIDNRTITIGEPIIEVESRTSYIQRVVSRPEYL